MSGRFGGGIGSGRRRRLAAAVAVAVAALGWAGCGAEAPRPDALEGTLPEADLSAADPAVRRQIEAARLRLEEAQERGAGGVELAEAFGRLGQHYHVYDLLEPAEACYARARALAPDDPRWTYYLGAVHLRRGRPEAAAGEFRSALERRPGDAALLLRLGEAELAAGRPEEAARRFAAALEAEPRCFAARYGLGEAARKSGDLAAAAEHFARVLEQQPTAEQVHYPLGQVLSRLGRRAEAEEHLRRAAGREMSVGGRPACPDRFDEELGRLATGAAALMRRGQVAAHAGRPEEAVALFRRAVELAPDDPLARQSLAAALLKGGELEESKRHYEAALELDPDNAALWSDLGALALRQGRFEEARRRFDEALRREPGASRYRLQLAAAYLRLDRCEEALALLDALLAEEPGNRAARTERAVCRARLGRRSAAAEDLGYLLETAPPDDPAERLQIAMLQLSVGDLESAVRHLEAVAGSRAPASIRARAHLAIGSLRLQRGDRAGAEESFTAALELDPASREVRRALDGLRR